MPAERVLAPYPFSYCAPGDVSLVDIEPVLAGPTVLEPKLDGFRIQMHIINGEVRTYTRTSHVADGKMPAVEGAVLPHAREWDDTVLDGEAVVFNQEGYPDFNATARFMGSQVDECVRKQKSSGNFVSYVIFDCMRWRGVDNTKKPYKDRAIDVGIFSGSINCPWIEIIPQRVPCLENHYFFTDEYGEGSVLKRLAAPYPGRRSKDWIKIKKVADADVVIMGYTPGQGKYEGQIGAVVFGQYKDGVLVSRGQCSGMTDSVRREFTMNLPLGRVMTISHMGFSAPESAYPGFRHPQYRRLRDPIDKQPEECIWE